MNTKIVQFVSIFLLAAVLIGTTVQPGFASTSVSVTASRPVTAQPVGITDPQEMEAFLDDFITLQMEENHIPGVVVSVVKDGALFFSKGYGFANLEGQVPVDPERTLFRVGSVSKLFTWTAVMQLVELGQLSLDTDVNQYLDFTIPATFPEPITLRHLMSHTAGFEFKGTNLWRLEAGQMVSLSDWMKDNLPERVFPAGEIAVYSNYGTALAGYIVERISGVSFDEYVEQRIFTPLGMVNSSFRQPLPSNLAVDMSTGYVYNDTYLEGSFEFQLPYPVGSLSATATDMARFMIAHLQNGEFDGQRILQEETALQMHSQLYTPDPRLESMAYGFFESTVNGQPMISHGGDTALFHSNLYLLPEQNVGLFISNNGKSGGNMVRTVQNAFLDHYYPTTRPPTPQSPSGFAERIAPYLGAYTEAQSNFTTYEKIYTVFSPITLSLDDNGILVLSRSGQKLRFVEVEPGLLQDLDDPANQWVYRTDPNGHLFLISSAPHPLIKTPWYGTGILHLLVFVVGTLMFLGALVVWPIGFIAGRRKRSLVSTPTPRPARLARWAAALFGLLWLVVLLGITSIFMDIVPVFGIPRIIYEAMPRLNVVLALSYGLAGLALSILVFAVLAWLRSYWRLGGRIFYSLLAFMALLLTWSLAYWNLFL